MKNQDSISRRNFLLQSTALMSASLISLPDGVQANAKKYKMGLQLFTVRAPMAADRDGTLKKVAALGYEDTETYGYDGAKKTFYGLPATDFKKRLEDNKLITTSGHYGFSDYFDKSKDDMLRFVDQCIEGGQAVGHKYITWPWLDPKFRSLENFKILAEKLNYIGDRVTKAGLGFAYHNHDFEFTDYNGDNGYEVILRDTDAKLVKLQIDLYWVMHSSKLAPAQLFRKQPGRFVMWHIKDMDKKTRDYTEMGNGSIDYTVILPDAKLSGLQYYYIEQGGNFAKDPIQSVTESAEFFKKNLEGLL